MSIALSPEGHFDVAVRQAGRTWLRTVATTLRAHHRRLIAMAGIGTMITIVVLNHHVIADSVRAAASSNPMWLVAAAVTAAITIPASALCMVGASGRELPLAHTSAIQLAGTFLNRMAPAGLGRAMVSVRYLTRNGLTAEHAVSTVAIGSIAGALARVGVAAAIWGIAAQSGNSALPHLVNPRVILIGAVAIAVAVAAIGLVCAYRPHHATAARGRCRALALDVSKVVSCPRSSARLLVGALFVHLAYLACFLVSLAAAGVTIDPTAAALAYFAGSAMANMAPTPGGLGGPEVALASAVMAIGVQADLAVAGVLIFRLATYWLLSIAGYVTWLGLRRKGMLA